VSSGTIHTLNSEVQILFLDERRQVPS